MIRVDSPAVWAPPVVFFIVLCLLGASAVLADDESIPGNAPTASEFVLPLPPDLSPEQSSAAKKIITEAETQLTALRREMKATLFELHNLSFAVETPPEELGILGRRLVATRNAILAELQQLCRRLEQEAGFNPGLEFRRTCVFQHSGHCGHRAACATSPR